MDPLLAADPDALRPPSNMGYGASGFRNWLRRLPDLIAAMEEDGQPIIVEFPPTLSPQDQALLATLGVLVRFKNEERGGGNGHRQRVGADRD